MEPRPSAKPQRVDVEIVPIGPVLEAMERVTIDKQVATAKAYPRDVEAAKKAIVEMATSSLDIAEDCWYELPRADGIDGPGIRLAEIVAYFWGNVRVAARVISIEEKFVTCQGVFHDLEKNVAFSSEIKRKITTKDGRRYSDDMIANAANAGNKIALRGAVFAGIPPVVLKEEFELIRQRAFEMGNFEEKKAKLFAWYEEHGASVAQVLGLAGRSSEDKLTKLDVQRLRRYATGVKDGTISMAELLGLNDPPSGSGLTPGRHKVGEKPKVPDVPVMLSNEPKLDTTDAPSPVTNTPTEVVTGTIRDAEIPGLTEGGFNE